MSQEQEMRLAFDVLAAVFPHISISVNFEVSRDAPSEFVTCGYTASAGSFLSPYSRQPMAAAKQLFKRLGITRVEQYIRCKEAGL